MYVLILFILKLNVLQGLYKYDQEIYDLLMDSCDLLPIACIVNGKFLAVHGGISPELKTVIFSKNII
jgi:serine/threonine-protein phosphatase 2B catalytic subunit